MTTKRAKLPGADELFRQTAQVEDASADQPSPLVAESASPQAGEAPKPQADKAPSDLGDSDTKESVDKLPRPQRALSTKLLRDVSPSPQLDKETGIGARKPRHDEKVTFYCTFEELTRVDEARVKLRRELGIVTDRGGLVRAAIGLALDDLDAEGSRAPLPTALQRGRSSAG